MRKLISPKKIDDISEESKITKNVLSTFLVNMQNLSEYNLNYIGTKALTTSGSYKFLDFPVLEKVSVSYYATEDLEQLTGGVTLPIWNKSSENFAYSEQAYAPWGGSEKNWTKAWYMIMPESYASPSSDSMIAIRGKVFTLSDGTSVTADHGRLDKTSIKYLGEGNGYSIKLILLDSSQNTLGNVYLKLLYEQYDSGSVDEVRKRVEKW